MKENTELPDAMQPGFFQNLKHDLPASLVVFLVATPLCLGIALASGAPLFAGIIAGIVGGIVVGSLSGSPLGVSGPAAGLAVIVLNAIATLGSFEAFLLAAVFAGAIQLALGYLRAGIIGYYFPSSVIKGMLAGIGLLIIIKQIPYAIGFNKPMDGVEGSATGLLTRFSEFLTYIQPGAVLITLISLAILILWDRPFMKKVKLFHWIQGPLVAVTAGILLNMLFQVMAPTLAIDASHLVQLPVAEGLSGIAGLFTFPDFSQLGNLAIYTSALTIAVVGSLETLLCVEATDKLDPQKRVTPTNRELKAQGIGNIISGLLGGLPVTQVIVRSSANIQSGGRTKTSAILHGVLLMSAALLMPAVLNLIPLATLAAILFVVGYKLSKPALYKTMYQHGWVQFVPFIVTIVTMLFTDLLIGICLGLAVAVFFILRNNFQNPFFTTDEPHKLGDPIHITLSEDVSFLNKASILDTLDRIPAHSEVRIDATKSVHIDHDVYEIFRDFEEKARLKNIRLTMVGFDTLEEDNDYVRRVHRVIRRERKRLTKEKQHVA